MLKKCISGLTFIAPLSRSSRPEVFCKKDVLKNFAKFTGKHLWQSAFFNKVAGLRPKTLLKIKLWHRCFPVNFAKTLRIPFFIEHLWWLLLSLHWSHVNGIFSSNPANIYLFKINNRSTRKKCETTRLNSKIFYLFSAYPSKLSNVMKNNLMYT